MIELATDMDAFEALVLSQKPAEKPWEPVTDYSFEARTQAEGIHPQRIVETFSPTRVLDVGCGTGFLVASLRGLGIAAIGCDTSAQVGHAWFYRQDICDSGPLDEWYLPCIDYDLVICREVMEHLTLCQIKQAVANLCALSSRFVYCTTRFSSEHDLLRVETSDDLDPTHITIASKDFYRLLFVLEGFKRRADLEERMDHQKKGRVLVYERAS